MVMTLIAPDIFRASVEDQFVTYAASQVQTMLSRAGEPDAPPLRSSDLSLINRLIRMLDKFQEEGRQVRLVTDQPTAKLHALPSSSASPDAAVPAVVSVGSPKPVAAASPEKAPADAAPVAEVPAASADSESASAIDISKIQVVRITRPAFRALSKEDQEAATEALKHLKTARENIRMWRAALRLNSLPASDRADVQQMLAKDKTWIRDLIFEVQRGTFRGLTTQGTPRAAAPALPARQC